MTSAFPTLREMFRKNGDMERGNGVFRVAIGGLFYLWMFVQLFSGSSHESPAFFAALTGYYALAWASLADTVRHPDRRAARLMMFCILDPFIVTYSFLSAGDSAAPFMFLLFTGPVASGLRFGRRYFVYYGCSYAVSLAVLSAFLPIFADLATIGSMWIAYAVVMLLAGSVIGKLASAKAKLAEMAMRDKLTGLPNRRMFLELLRGMLAGSKRANVKVACLFIDLDGFKAVNDTHGHRVGDLLLSRVGETLRERARASDVVARLSGDEFVLAAEWTNPDDAHILAKRVLHGIEGLREIDGKPVKVSASIGVAFYDPDTHQAPDSDKLLDAADHAMYDAKRGGKGRVAVAR